MGIKAARVGDNRDKHFGKKDNSKNPSRMLQFVPEDGITVRFLTDSDNWVWYQEYWDPALNKYVVATEENEDDYDERDIWPSNRYLAAAVRTDDNRVVAVKLTKTLADNIKMQEEHYAKKNKRLTDYDLALSKSGKGTDTTYHVMFEGFDDLDVSRYDVPDLFKVLESMLDTEDEGSDNIDDDNDVEETPKAPVKKTFKLKK